MALCAGCACGQPVLGITLNDACESLCCDAADRLEQCLDPEQGWSELGLADREAFVTSCQIDWTLRSARLTSFELQDALDVCVLGSETVEELAAEGEQALCDELLARYLPVEAP